MARDIAAFVQARHNVTFVELTAHLGQQAAGDLAIEFDLPSLKAVLWEGVSETFADALELGKGDIVMDETTPLVYMFDGAMMRLPLVKSARRYAKPHWLPVVFNPR